MVFGHGSHRFVLSLGQAAIRDPDPVVFLENELMYGVAFDVDDKVLESDFLLPIGKAKIQRPGNDLTIAAHSVGVQVKLL